MTDMHDQARENLLSLPHLGVLAIDGSDAASFLQGQATCDCRQLSPQTGALGALCNLQGRMIVSFYVLAVADGLRLIMPRDRVQAVLTHLKKYAVFSKVSLRDDSDACQLLGGVDDGETEQAFSVSMNSEKHFVLHLRGRRALHLIIDGKDTPGMGRGTGSAARVGNGDSWRAASIRAGELLVDTANAEKFLPQALNYDVINGVNFKKGCYTGQEVVARMHFKGTMKERLYVASAETASAPAAGTAVLDANGKAVGEILDAVVSGGHSLIGAVLRHDAVAAGQMHVESGIEIKAERPPYPFPE